MCVDTSSIAETLRQVVEGGDFDPPAKILKSVTAENAVLKPPGCPYSIATNVAHAEQWQRSWLNRLKGMPRFDVYKEAKDFPIIAAADWPAVRAAFVDGLVD